VSSTAPTSTHLGSNKILDALARPTHAIRPTLIPLLIEQVRDALFVAHALFAPAEGLEADDFAALFQVEEFVEEGVVEGLRENFV
jgi:hypothetical protein